jgi:hypothetical protein
MANQFLDHAEAILIKVQSPLTFNEIWEKGVELGLHKKIKTEGKTPWNSMGAQLFVDFRDNPDSRFITENLDWDTMNKLCEENEDFKKFIQDVKIDFESKRVHKSEYDKIDDEIDVYIAKKMRKYK